MDVILWQLQLSNFNEKVRWALDFKGVAHRRRSLLPGAHRAAAAAVTRGRHSRLPVLRIDGRGVGGSGAIVAALEEHAPDPPLYPADPALRARALELEALADRELGPATRSFTLHHALQDREEILRELSGDHGPAARTALRLVVPVMGPIARRDYGLGDEARHRVVAAADRIEAELDGGTYLVGDRFSVADLAAAALVTPIIEPAGRQYSPGVRSPGVLELRAELEARPFGRWVHEMFRRHRGVSAEIR